MSYNKNVKSRSSEYYTWQNIKNRCYKTNRSDYPRYGGRGIKVCPQWINSFDQFILDMGPKPSKDHSLDRIDNDGDYTPDNCRWATKSQQQNNKRNNRIVIWNNQEITLSELAHQYGLTYQFLYSRLDLGFTLQEAVYCPKNVKLHSYRNQSNVTKKIYEYNNELYSIRQLAIIFNKSEAALTQWFKRGKTASEICINNTLSNRS